MTWSREHYEAIAKILKNYWQDEQLSLSGKQAIQLQAIKQNETQCNKFANFLEGTSPRFNRDRFMNACVVKVE